jgi:transposase
LFGCAIGEGVAQSRAMTITPHDPEDRQRLSELIARERNAKQRDRYRAVLLAMDGMEGDEIALRLARSPRFVDEWAARYRRGGGIDALVPKRQSGRPPKLTPEQEQRLKARLDAGPRDTDGVCTLRGRDVCRIIAAEFGVVHTLGGIYDVLRRIGYSSLVPRPRHRKNEAAAMAKFTDRAPLLPGR